MTDAQAPARPRPYHHGDLRQALLAAAEAELEADGIEGFSLRRVAKCAGVSHAAPAHHFGDAAGLLTALAAEGFRRFLATQHAREAAASAPSSPRDRLVAAGLGYVDFACAHPALFRLLFASERPDFADPLLRTPARAAYQHLLDGIAAIRGAPPDDDPAGMADVTACWAIVHGLADLSQAGRLAWLQALPGPEREALMREVIGRVLPR